MSQHLSLVTPIGPNFSVEFLEEAARSVKSLDLDVEWLIAAPLGSRRAIAQVMEDVEMDRDWKLFERHTGNIAATRNFLFERTVKKYVMHFDCDDILVPAGVHALINKIEKEDLRWGASTAIDFTDERCPASPPGKWSEAHRLEESFENGILPKGAVTERRRRNKKFAANGLGWNGFHPGACIAQRFLMLTVGGYDELLGNLFEDYIPWMLMSAGDEGVWSPLPSLLYRKHAGSVTVKPNSDPKAIDEYVTQMEDLAAEVVESGDYAKLHPEYLRSRLGRE